MKRVRRAGAAVLAVAMTAVLATSCTVASGVETDVAAFVDRLQATPLPAVEERPALAASADQDMLWRLASAAIPDDDEARSVLDAIAPVEVDDALFDGDDGADAVRPRRLPGGSGGAPRSATELGPLGGLKAAGLSMYLGAVKAIAKPSGLTAGTDRSSTDGPVSTAYSFDGQHLRGTVTLSATSTDPITPAVLTSQLEFDLQGCPAADGSFTAEVRSNGRLDATTRSGGAAVESWAAESWSVALSGQVGDDARIADASIDHRQEMTSGAASGGTREGSDFASEWGFAYERDAEGEVSMSPDGLPRVGRSSSAVSTVDEIRILTAQWQAAQLQTVVAMDAIEGILRSGLCVQLSIEGPATLPIVEPGSTTTVVARPVLRSDGSPVGGIVTAEVTHGKGAIEPATAAAPSTHFYAAPFENDHTTVAFSATSRAGVGLATQVFAVGGGWRVVRDVAEVHTEGQKCGPVTGDWTLTAAGKGWDYAATAAVRIGADLTGTYVITGTTEMSAFEGGGTVWLVPSGEDYLMYFDTSDAPMAVTRDASLYGCAYETH